MGIQITEDKLSNEARKELNKAGSKSQFLRDALEYYVKYKYLDMKSIENKLSSFSSILASQNTTIENLCDILEDQDAKFSKSKSFDNLQFIEFAKLTSLTIYIYAKLLDSFNKKYNVNIKDTDIVSTIINHKNSLANAENESVLLENKEINLCIYADYTKIEDDLEVYIKDLVLYGNIFSIPCR